MSAAVTLPAGVTPLAPFPTPSQLAWQRRETVLFIHFGPNTFTDREWGDGTENPSLFNPAALDCGQWAEAARAAGFSLAILTAKHHDGFCLWPSRRTRHSVASSPWRGGRGDVVREFVEAFAHAGLDVGLYLSPWDRHEPSYGDSPRYNRFYLDQMTELLGGDYGPIREVWFDGACGEGPNGKQQAYDWHAYIQRVRELQPQAVIFGDGGTDVRWVGNEEGFAGDPCWAMVDSRVVPYPGAAGLAQATGGQAVDAKRQTLHHGNEDGDIWQPAESDVSIRPGWFYHAAEDEQVRSVDNLVELYFQSVGRNSLLLLNVPPTPQGLLHAIDVERLKAFRRRLEGLFDRDLALDASAVASASLPGCEPRHAVGDDARTFWAQASATGWIELQWSEPRSFDVLLLQEPIHLGQRVAEHRVEAALAGRWQPIATGSTIGYKRLHRIAPTTADRLRLHIDRSRGPITLSRIGLFRSGD